MSKQKNNLNIQTLLIYWRHAKVYWPLLIMCAMGIVINICCDLGSPIVYKKFFDLLALDPFHKSQAGTLNDAYYTIALIGVIAVGSWIGMRICLYAVNNFESRCMADLSNFCFEYIHNHSYRFFTDNFAGALVKRINRFSAGFETIGDQCTLQLGPTAIRIVLVIGILFWRNTILGCVFLAWTIILILFNIFFSQYRLKFDLRRAEMDTKVTGHLSDTITNSTTVKLFAGLPREVEIFESITDEHRIARYLSWKMAERSNWIQGLSIRILEVTVLIIAVKYWYQGILTLGDFILLRSYLYQLVDKVQEIGQSVRRIYETMADANEMTEILLTPHEVCDDPNARPVIVKEGTIDFKNVTFGYKDGGHQVITNLNLRIKPGERIGIVGPSGGGKSTLLKLLIRLYDAKSGTVSIDGQDIREVTQLSLHRSIAYVPQDPILFHRSLMNNIRYSRPEATDEEVIKASKLAHCHEFISKLELGYQTLVGERGIKLSGGERQRIAIARAILMDAPIILLDEATSSLDTESEVLIQKALSTLVSGKTVIAIAHRLSTIRKMGRILVIKDGKIIEDGNHDILVRMNNGMYNKLWGLQTSDLAEANL